MLIAKQKRKENIAEYILYLYQVEDLIRAFRFDMNLIQEKLIARYETGEEEIKEITDWYNNLVLMMDREEIREKGHLQFLTNLIGDVNEFHIRLMKGSVETDYVRKFKSVAGLISELNKKNMTAANDIQLVLDTIYGFLLLKMKKAEISPETTNAVKQLSEWLAVLSKLYKDFELGNMEL